MARSADLVDFVEHHGSGLQRAETVRKAFRDKQLITSIAIQFDRYVLAEGGRRTPKIDHNIENGPVQHPYKFGLSEGRSLEV
jgi:hypothetical protein